MKIFKKLNIGVFAAFLCMQPGFGIAQTAAQKGENTQSAGSGNSITAADVNLSLGILPAGETVIIEFEVDVAATIPNGVTEIANQGVVTGDNFADVLTDDPDVGGAFDPTLTPIKALDLGVIALNAPGADCGLTGNESVTITIYNFASVAQSNFDVSFNFTGPTNSSATETVAQTVPASGGTLVYTFAATADLSLPGSYSVTVSTLLSGDSQPGNDALITSVLSSPPPVVDAGADHFITEYQSVQLGASPTASSGTPPFTYSWTPTAGLDDPNSANPVAAPNSATEYTVTVTDAAGCFGSDMTFVDYIDLRILVEIAIVDIDYVLQNQTLSWIARNKLQAARADLVNTLNYLDADDWSNAAVALESAIDHSEDAINFGANLTTLFNDLIEPTHTLAVLTLQVAQPLAGSNSALNAAIAYAQSKLANGDQDRAAGDLAAAIKDYLYSYGGSRYVIENAPGGGAKMLANAANTAKKEAKTSELTEITASSTDKGVVVSWASISEKNNKGFYLYRAVQTLDAMAQADIQQKSGVPADVEYVRLNKKKIKGAGSSLQRNDYSYTDSDIQAGYVYYYKIMLDKKNGKKESPYGTVTEVVVDAPTAQSKKVNIINSTVPLDFVLEQNYPNPFNPTTKIRFALPEAATVKLEIYNTSGQRVRTLVSGDHAPGTYEIDWDARNDTGQSVASGIYLYHLQAGGFTEVRKMSFLK
ncbi:MAG: T9SS C-terminal target domain-containing protein [Calditrichaeota bacterium]|nr:MAG: T9SS C-terminal target domain-containing protein [Calditrichota bacterium]